MNKKFILLSFLLFMTNIYSYVPKGLPNLGLTCFMNAALQCLYAVDDLREFLLDPENEDFYKQGSLSDELRLFFKDYDSSAKTVDPRKIVKVLQTQSGFAEFTADDTYFVVLNILDGLCKKDIKPEKIKSFYGYPNQEEPKFKLSDLFNRFKESYAMYDINNKFYSEIINNAIEKILMVPKIDYKGNLLNDLYELERLSEVKGALVLLDNCNFIIKDYSTFDSIIYLPKILIIKFDYIGEKVFEGVPFDEKLDLSEVKPAVIKGKEFNLIPKNQQTKYDLFAVAMHHGIAFHWSAYVKTENIWYYCNDSSVTSGASVTSRFNQIRTQHGGHLDPTPIILFYKQQEPIEEKLIMNEDEFLSKINPNFKPYLNNFLRTNNIQIQDILKGLNESIVTVGYINTALKQFACEIIRVNRGFSYFESSLHNLNARLQRIQ